MGTSGSDPTQADAGAGELLQPRCFRERPECWGDPGWDVSLALGTQHKALVGDAGLRVPQHCTCGPWTASPVRPVAAGQLCGPVRPGCAASVST